jgi:hypothetical protein
VVALLIGLGCAPFEPAEGAYDLNSEPSDDYGCDSLDPVTSAGVFDLDDGAYKLFFGRVDPDNVDSELCDGGWCAACRLDGKDFTCSVAPVDEEGHEFARFSAHGSWPDATRFWISYSFVSSEPNDNDWYCDTGGSYSDYVWEEAAFDGCSTAWTSTYVRWQSLQ